MELENFIKENRQRALIVIRNSKYFKKLDHMEIEEIIHCGLWKCFRTFDESKGSLSSFLNLVINCYIFNIVRKKINKREIPLEFLDDESLIYKDKTPIEYSFTDSEWDFLSPLMQNSKLEMCKKNNLSYGKYDRTLKIIYKTIKTREYFTK